MEKKIFYFSLIMVLASLFSTLSNIRMILAGTAFEGNFSIIGSSVLIYIMAFFYFTNKNWKFGLLFLLASSLIRQFSGIIFKNSLFFEISLNILSLLLLVPALIFFWKLREKN